MFDSKLAKDKIEARLDSRRRGRGRLGEGSNVVDISQKDCTGDAFENGLWNGLHLASERLGERSMSDVVSGSAIVSSFKKHL